MEEKEAFYCCESLGRKIALTLRAMVKATKRNFESASIDLTPEQFFILNILDDNEGIILKELAELLEKDKSAIARHINVLEEKHFVARVTCEEDKRKKLLILTKPGLKTLAKANEISKAKENEATENLSETDLEIFEQVLFDIINKSQEKPVG
ncbi:MAG TPA: MarR family transcriptional regulator [Balneolaceae bacterium]|nr:MarR family transcriptional regulator [Balneolaceae bacterium]